MFLTMTQTHTLWLILSPLSNTSQGKHFIFLKIFFVLFCFASLPLDYEHFQGKYTVSLILTVSSSMCHRGRCSTEHQQWTKCIERVCPFPRIMPKVIQKHSFIYQVLASPHFLQDIMSVLA